MNGRPAVPDADAVVTAQQVAAMKIEATGRRLVVPSVGLNVPIDSMNVVDGVIAPPGFTSAYWVRDIGTSLAAPDAGTVYLVVHSLRAGTGPGNYLIDAKHGSAAVHAGDKLVAANVTYTVVSTAVVAKQQLPRDVDVWTSRPGRLVLITCLQRPDGSQSRDNVIIVGTRQH